MNRMSRSSRSSHSIRRLPKRRPAMGKTHRRPGLSWARRQQYAANARRTLKQQFLRDLLSTKAGLDKLSGLIAAATLKVKKSVSRPARKTQRRNHA